MDAFAIEAIVVFDAPRLLAAEGTAPPQYEYWAAVDADEEREE